MDFGFKKSPHNHCLFVKGEEDEFMALIVYVDEVLIRGPNEILINQFKEYLHKMFTIKDLGQESYFLGIELLKTKKVYTLNKESTFLISYQIQD